MSYCDKGTRITGIFSLNEDERRLNLYSSVENEIYSGNWWKISIKKRSADSYHWLNLSKLPLLVIIECDVIQTAVIGWTYRM